MSSSVRNKPLVFGAVLSIAAGMLLLGAGPASAAPGWTVVVPSGLDNPRHLSFGPNGQLYVAEAGRGGSTCVSGGPGGPESESCFGTTSKVTAVDVSTGATRTVVDGLFSIAGSDGSFATGADGLSFMKPRAGHYKGTGPLWVQMSGNTAPVPPGDNPLLNAGRAQLGQLLRVGDDGTWTAVAPVGDTDRQWTVDHASLDPNNPEWPDANPYGIAAAPGRVYVTDAAANTLDLVRPNGSISVLAYFPNTNLTQFSDAVPTCVVQTSHGIYVGDLNGQLWRYTGSFTPEHVTLSGDPLASIEGCATDGNHVYVVDMFGGQVARIDATGQVTSLAQGLNFPGGVAVGPNHALYVTNNGVSSETGQIVRLSTS